MSVSLLLTDKQAPLSAREYSLLPITTSASSAIYDYDISFFKM